MAAPVYPGDLSNNDPASPDSVNDRVLPLFRALNATGGGITGVTGITDDHILAGALSPDRINGTVMTLDDAQTASGNKIFSGDVTVGLLSEFRVDVTSVREFGTNSTGGNGGSATNDTTPDCGGVVSLAFDYSSPTSVTLLDNPTEGQVIHITNHGSNVTFNNNTGGVGSMLMRSGANTVLAAAGIMFVARDDTGGGGVIKWYEV